MKNYYYINKKNLQIETTTNDSNIDKLNKDLIFLKKITQNTQDTQKHPYHLVDPSPWPFIISFGLFFLTFGSAMYFHNYIGSNILTLIGFLLIILTMYTWFRDIVREAVYEGQHTKQVQFGLRNGMLLFIFSELLLFVSFFWAFFHSALAPIPEIGSLWPPLGIETVNTWGIPLLNTIILLSSGATITWAHHSIVFGDRQNTIISLIITILLAFFFTLIQSYEYIEISFSVSDSVYGAIFFLITGFHGIHVIVGTIFIIVSTIRLINHHFTKQHHFGFEATAWYWHFVDVIWLFLFVTLYWWGGN
uniref:Cytochrome c oxidase subunit 3 n=1 Tax=Peronospora tabacina TaxID=230439 RepID=A0A0P0H5S5_9STRA|nr:cytochrome c oxidase subunit 3 [Peronospora tabacina]ALJ78424.1 cytochrome c oxidase subunit 3 [Peronospora tabacina]ALJ78471.1 cytochrome c oxidase subunit 3 [Peronospora tabacina]